MNNFQRIGSESNSQVGRDFESVAHAYFRDVEGICLTRQFRVALGLGAVTKPHKFDLGSDSPAILVACKSHRWTVTGKTPSAKVTVLKESMFYFHLAPSHFRKVLFVLRDVCPKRSQSLAEYFVAKHAHLIPADVSVMEFNEESKSALIVRSAIVA